MAGFVMPSTADSQRIVHINAVDTVNRRASGMWSDGGECGPIIDTRYQVGGVQVTPYPGEIWLVERSGPVYTLVRKMPAHTPDLSGETVPVPGQTQMGGRGPTELLGSQVNAHAPFSFQPVEELPDAAEVGAGASVYHRGLSKPVYSDGTAWRDAAGVLLP